MKNADSGMSSKKYRFADLELDLEGSALWRKGEQLELHPLTFALLAELVRKSPAVCQADDLIELLWPDVFVGEENLKQRVRLLRKVLGDDAKKPTYVETVRGWGYRLVPEAEAVEGGPVPASRSLPRVRWLGGLAAGGALLMVVFAAALFRPPSVDTPHQSDPARVVIAPFENLTGDESLDSAARIATDWVSRNLLMLNQAGVVVEPAEFSLPKGLSESRERWLHSIARRVPENSLAVVGTFYRQEPGFEFQVQVIDPHDGELLDGISQSISTIQDLPRGLSPLVDHLAAEVATRLGMVDSDTLVVSAHPTSFEAYTEYTRCMERYLALDFAGALAHCNLATQSDPDFHLSDLVAVEAEMNLGQLTAAQTRIAKLAPFRDQMSPFDRHILDRQKALVRGDFNGALAIARRLAEIAPASGYGYDAARTALMARRPHESVHRFAQWESTQEPEQIWFPYWWSRAMAEHAVGLQEGDTVAHFRSLFPTSISALLLDVRLVSAQGHAQQALTLIREAGSRPRFGDLAAFMLANGAISEASVHGQSEAAAVIGSALQHEMEKRAATCEGPCTWRAEAWRLLKKTRWGAESMSIDKERAERLAALVTVKEHRASYDVLGLESYGEAVSTGWRGDTQAALAALRRAIAEGYLPWDRRSLHSDPCLQPLWSEPEFKELIEGPEEEALGG